MPNFKNRKSKRAKIFGPRGKAPISSRIEIIWSCFIKIKESKKLVKKVGLAKNLKEGKVFEVDAEKQQNSLFDIPISLIEKLITAASKN